MGGEERPPLCLGRVRSDVPLDVRMEVSHEQLQIQVQNPGAIYWKAIRIR